MQLGDLLKKEPGVCCVVRRVVVQIVHQVEGVEHKTEAPALLAPVVEARYEEARRFAEDWLLRMDPTSPYRLAAEGEDRVPLQLPPDVLERERDRAFLCYVLRDADSPAQPFVKQKDYGVFRKGLVRRQVTYLLEEYSRFLNEEYPETVPADVAAQLAAEAEGKS